MNERWPQFTDHSSHFLSRISRNLVPGHQLANFRIQCLVGFCGTLRKVEIPGSENKPSRLCIPRNGERHFPVPAKQATWHFSTLWGRSSPRGHQFPGPGRPSDTRHGKKLHRDAMPFWESRCLRPHEQFGNGFPWKMDQRPRECIKLVLVVYPKRHRPPCPKSRNSNLLRSLQLPWPSEGGAPWAGIKSCNKQQDAFIVPLSRRHVNGLYTGSKRSPIGVPRLAFQTFNNRHCCKRGLSRMPLSPVTANAVAASC